MSVYGTYTVEFVRYDEEDSEIRKTVEVEVSEEEKNDLWKLVWEFGYGTEGDYETGEPKFEKYLMEVVMEEGEAKVRKEFGEGEWYWDGFGD